MNNFEPYIFRHSHSHRNHSFPFPFPWECVFLFPLTWVSSGNRICTGNLIPTHISRTGVHESIYQRRRLDGDWEQRKSSSASSSAAAAAAHICLRLSINCTYDDRQDKSISTSVGHPNYSNDHVRGLLQRPGLKQCTTDDNVWSRALQLWPRKCDVKRIQEPTGQNERSLVSYRFSVADYTRLRFAGSQCWTT